MNFCTELSGFRSLLASATVPIPRMEGRMYQQFRSHDFNDRLVHSDAASSDAASTAIARGSGIDALAALEQIGTRRSFTRDEAVYPESDLPDCWSQAIPGTVPL